MSPVVESKPSKGRARVLGSGIAGLCELSIFHPVDTVAKRLMNSPVELTRANYAQVIFQEKPQRKSPVPAAPAAPAKRTFSARGFSSTSPPIISRVKSLYPGIGYGALYKVTQRIYKFGGQPVVNDWIKKASATSATGSPFFSNAIAGSLVGVGEVALLPFDVLKIKKQTSAEYRALGIFEICKREGFSGLYAGAGWTAGRNILGSFVLFGVNAWVKDAVGGSQNSSRPTLSQIAISSTAGSVGSILVACPLDVVKTRMQSGGFKGKSGMSIIRSITAQEGVGGFFKGAVPKVLTVGPKLIFSFTLAQYLIEALQ